MRSILGEQDARRESGNERVVDASEFQRNFNKFSFKSLFTQPEIIRMLELIQIECSSLTNRRIFKLSGSATRSQRLDDFKSSQAKHLNDFVAFVDKEWMENICTCVTSSLSGVSKGWFTIDETDEKNYRMSNLRYFFKFVCI